MSKNNFPHIYSTPRLPFSPFFPLKKHSIFVPPIFFVHVDLEALRMWGASSWAPEPKHQYSYHHQLESKCLLHAFDLTQKKLVSASIHRTSPCDKPNPSCRVSQLGVKLCVCGWLIIFVYRCFLIYRFLKVGGPVLKLLDPPPFGLSNFRSAKFWFLGKASHSDSPRIQAGMLHSIIPIKFTEEWLKRL